MTGLYVRAALAAVLGFAPLWAVGNAAAQDAPAPKPDAPRSHLVGGGQGLMLYSGERATFTLSGSYVVKLDRVEPAQTPPADLKPGQVSMKLEPAPQETQPQASHLVVRNWLDHPLRFHASIARPGEDGAMVTESTSTCPAQPKVLGIESWPYAVDALLIMRPWITKVGDTVCDN